MNTSHNRNTLAIEKLTFSFPTLPEKQLFKECSLAFPNSEISAILGPSGCGKSTLFKLMTGLLPTKAGELFIGKNIGWVENAKRIAFMQQDDLLLPWMTAYDNIMLPITINKKSEDKAIIEGVIDEFSLREVMLLFPHELSGGLRKRIALLRTYAMNREIILLDEPFSSLDYFTRNALYEWLQVLHQKLPRTTILITHDLDEAICMANNIYLFNTPPHTTIEIVRNEERYPRTVESMVTPNSLYLKKELMSFFRERIIK